jgi:hypothetical protein
MESWPLGSHEYEPQDDEWVKDMSCGSAQWLDAVIDGEEEKSNQ